MQVILRQDVEKLGLRGEVAELRKHEEKRARQEAQSFDQAQEIVARLESEEIRFDVPAGETGTLFGSVTATDVAERVWADKRVRVDRRRLDLPESIKRIGRYQVPVELFPDVTATLRLAIVPEGGELPPEEELEALAAEEAQAEADAQAQAEADHEQAEAEIQAVVEEDEDEAEEEIQAEPEAPAAEPDAAEEPPAESTADSAPPE